MSARSDKAKTYIKKILSPAGISIDGKNPWDLRVVHEGFYERVRREGGLGFGESYMDGWWECERIDEFFSRLMPTEPEKKIKKNLKLLISILNSVIFNPGKKSRAYQVGIRHYDIGNELYKYMLDRRMVYSCAYWKDAKTLDEAQEAKLDLICRKLGLKPGDRVLDIGCGWGSFAKYAAEKYGVGVVGITVSKEQAALGRELCEGLPVEIRFMDYRDADGLFDHIVSIGMFEHVGHKNYRTYMEKVHRRLKDNGLFLLHTIGNNVSQIIVDPWLEKYIFPNSLIPSMRQITTAIEGLFIVEDWHNFGYYYDTTLMSWFRNFDRNWDMLKGKYDERFYRMWEYYLLSSAGVFRSRTMQVWQIVLSKRGVPGGYTSIR